MKKYAPAVARNREPLLEMLRVLLPTTATVLELSSGSGEHAHFFSEQLPQITWRPSDLDDEALASIAAFQSDGPANMAAPVRLDALDADWGTAAEDINALVCINMIHIAPWACCKGLMAGAERHLPPGGALILYGPYRFDGAFTAPSNEKFDAWLRDRDPSWGVRDVSEVTQLANDHQLDRQAIHEMPANNHILLFRRH
jgi:cyclopropane fatty-acyl-phospholipid synthase-like methyltransferase